MVSNVWEGDSLTRVEPALEEAEFERYIKSLIPLMHTGRDASRVLGGRTGTNSVKIKRVLARNPLRAQTFHLCDNAKQMMQYGHFKRQRGVAKSRSHEVMFLCFTVAFGPSAAVPG